MNRTRKSLAAVFLVLAAMGVGSAGQVAGASADSQVSATRWCC